MMNINNDEMMKRHQNGKRLAGIVVVLVGAVLLGKQFGLVIPEWVFSWPMLLIVIGLYIGARQQFRRPGWIILCLVGSVFLVEHLVEGISIGQFFWPVLIIAGGLIMIFSPRRKKWSRDCWPEKWDQKDETADNKRGDFYNREDYIESVGIFGGIKKTVLSKDFKGGEIVSVFSGAEVNLTQAEIKGHVVLEIVNVFGGTKLIVPANWEIKSEMVAIMGSIEDKRIQQTNVTNGVDVLVIQGTTVFGGIEIKSY